MIKLCRTAVLIAVFAVFGFAQARFAQPSGKWSAVRSLQSGTQVRIVIGSSKLTGNLESASDGGLVIATSNGEQTVNRELVNEVAMVNGSRRMRHALIGLAIGGGGGAVAGFASTSGCNGIGCIGSDAVKIAAPVAGAVVGFGIGYALPSGSSRVIYKR